MIESPYKNRPRDEWQKVTSALCDDFPLSMEKVVSICQQAWNDFYNSSFGSGDLIIGQDIFLPAQATGVILEKLIASKLQKEYPNVCRGGLAKTDKDIINIETPCYSFEIKTSSSPNGLYGNRSTGNRSDNSQKVRTGYYLVINYLLPKEDAPNKKIRKIRFGWIDDDDWVGQNAASGQQASIGAELAKLKLRTLYEG